MPKRSDAEEVAAALTTAERMALDRKIKALEQQVRDKTALYKQAITELEKAHQQAEFLSEMDEPLEVSPWERKLTEQSKSYCAIVAASDWHIGETIESKQVRGFNAFNQSVALRRVKKFFLKIPEYCERYAPEAKLVYLWAGGDFISGQIHDELRENNHKSATEECLWFRELWSDGLATLLKELPGVRFVIPTSMGNHGRTTVKPRSSTAAKNSYEQMTYHVLARDWRNEPRVSWRVTDGYHNVLEICGRKVRFHHGDAMSFWGGVGGITIPVRKAISQWNKTERCDLDIFGHFHEYLDGGDFIANGSLVGYSPFSVRIKAGYQPPIQAFLVFDKKHGLRQSTRIFVDD
jgi:hypothetical protein